VQNLHALAAMTLQSRQFFAMTLGDQLFEEKKNTHMKKLKLVPGKRTFRGLSNCTQQRFLQTREH